MGVYFAKPNFMEFFEISCFEAILTYSQLSDLSLLFVKKEYPAGEILLKEGSESTNPNFLIIESGSINLKLGDGTFCRKEAKEMVTFDIYEEIKGGKKVSLYKSYFSVVAAEPTVVWVTNLRAFEPLKSTMTAVKRKTFNKYLGLNQELLHLIEEASQKMGLNIFKPFEGRMHFVPALFSSRYYDEDDVICDPSSKSIELYLFARGDGAETIREKAAAEKQEDGLGTLVRTLTGFNSQNDLSRRTSHKSKQTNSKDEEKRKSKQTNSKHEEKQEKIAEVRHLGVGDVSGEDACVFDYGRDSTLTATEHNCIVLCMRQADYNSALALKGNKLSYEYMVLQFKGKKALEVSSNLFDIIPRDKLLMFASMASLCSFPKHTSIFCKKDEAKSFYVILKGRVALRDRIKGGEARGFVVVLYLLSQVITSPSPP
jgi:hypothetical protein